ncbi:MAG: OmpA family protein [Gammaproteobacteria bacterium]|nr:OmpA family protein [Gammaproteobacteria bacterium]
MKPNKLDELRDILLRPDHEKLEILRARVEQADQRAVDVAEVLPDSVAASFERDSRLVAALRKPLRRCVSESVREDPEEYADALFPIMGPAIRRSVAEAFKAWIQQANQAIEQSLSPRGLSWRFQAWRAGIPFGQYVLQHTLLYRVEHVYLIHAESGLLISHAQQGSRFSKDEDAVSAMLTAIQEFVKDSFSADEPQRLRTAELGELTLWAVHGPAAVLVAVIRGVPPAALRADLEAALERIETRSGEALRSFDGDRDGFEDVEPDLKACLQVSLRDSAAAKPQGRFSPAVAMLTVLALALASWVGYGVWMQNRLARVADAFDAASGIVATRIDRAGRTLIVRGLRDPLAPTAEEVAITAGWHGSVDAQFEPYVSLDRALVLARAHATLQPPETVDLELSAGTLRLAGSAPAEWVTRVHDAPLNVPGVDRLETSALIPDSGSVSDSVSLLARLRELLDPPDGVALAFDGRVLQVTGAASRRWLDRVLDQAPLPGVTTVDYAALEITERRALEAIANEVNGIAIDFEAGEVALDSEHGAIISDLASKLDEFGVLATTLELEPRLTVTGHSDESGTDEFNLSLERRRADAVSAALREAGLEPAWIGARSQLEGGDSGPRAPQVSLQLQALPLPANPAQD